MWEPLEGLRVENSILVTSVWVSICFGAGSPLPQVLLAPDNGLSRSLPHGWSKEGHGKGDIRKFLMGRYFGGLDLEHAYPQETEEEKIHGVGCSRQKWRDL